MSVFTGKLPLCFLVCVIIATAIFSLFFAFPLSQLVLMIPFREYNESFDSVNRDFIITCLVSFFVCYIAVFFMIILYGCIFVFRARIFHKTGRFVSCVLVCVYNIIPWLLIFDVLNIIFTTTHLFGSDSFKRPLFEHSKFVSFVTCNYMPWYGRVCSIVIIHGLSFAVDIYAWIIGHQLPLYNITLTTPKLDKELTFVHISDVHIGSRDRSHAVNISKKIVKIDPDFVVITGDLTDSPNVIASDLEPFSEVAKKCPVYMCTGNHDYMIGIRELRKMTEECGITLLEGQVINIDEHRVGIAAVDDYNKAKDYVIDMKKLVPQLNKGNYNIMLHHRPQGYVETCSTGVFDLMLAGHTHVGQFAPFSVLVYLFFPKAHGLYTIHQDGNTMKLYTHPGTGAWAAPMRTAGKNRITIFHIKPTFA